MKNVPKLFGFPLWEGNLRYRYVKKLLKKHHMWQIHKLNVSLRDAVPGFSINDCSGFNHRVVNVEPIYHNLNNVRNRGAILIDVDIITEGGPSCSLAHCGVEPAKSRDDIEKSHLTFLKTWGLGDGAEAWYGPDYPENKERIQSIVNLLESGGHICDEQGFLLEEFRRSARI